MRAKKCVFIGHFVYNFQGRTRMYVTISSQYCHRLHVVHRDLKPENVVFFEKLGLVKLTDFGFSNQFRPGQQWETRCGSLAYSAPEILLGDSYDAPAVGKKNLILTEAANGLSGEGHKALSLPPKSKHNRRGKGTSLSFPPIAFLINYRLRRDGKGLRLPRASRQDTLCHKRKKKDPFLFFDLSFSGVAFAATHFAAGWTRNGAFPTSWKGPFPPLLLPPAVIRFGPPLEPLLEGKLYGLAGGGVRKRSTFLTLRLFARLLLPPALTWARRMKELSRLLKSRSNTYF